MVGEAGLGKSALLNQIADDRRGELRVIGLAGVEVESTLAFAGLATLVGRSASTLDHMDHHLAEVLRGAIGSSEVSPSGLDVNLSMLAFVAALAAEAPTLVLVDDAHWLDQASLSVLTFVARRLDDDPAVVLFGTRPSPATAPYLQAITSIDLEPMALGNSVDLLAQMSVVPLVAAECWRRTGGNPLALLELARRLPAEQRSARTHCRRPPPRAYLSRRCSQTGWPTSAPT